MNPLQVEIIPDRSDNYIFLIYCTSLNEAVVVDPCSSSPVIATLKKLGLKLASIWNTHHHNDHVGGNLELKQATQCQIIGSNVDRARIPGIDIGLSGGDSFSFAGRTIQVIDTPGHTKGAISFWVRGDLLLFCGDTLFSLGCGRLFEGTPQEMWESLGRIKQLPVNTKIYCAHEYTENNGSFALTVEPENKDLQTRFIEVKKLRKMGIPTIPTKLKLELDSNPFLRADSAAIRKRLGMQGSQDWEVFAAIRSMKDRF